MIELTRGNLLEADTEAIVNTVNTVGVMGKGIALQFKKAFPENFRIYEKACAKKEVVPGKMLVVDNRELTGPRYIINFPTKRHWRGKSKMEDIESGLRALVQEVKTRDINSIALPPLGCGNGGLRWSEVLPRITAAFAELPNVRVLVFEPAGAPSPRRIIDRTKRPNMTISRAAVLCLMNRYLVPGYPYRLSMLEIQKLAYFMQTAGETLKLNFQKHHYGPYADNLRKSLVHMEGHFIEGYGDGVGTNAPDTPITLLADAADEAEEFVKHDAETQRRFQAVADLIEGYETPYGMELLSTVHWVVTKELGPDNATLDNIVAQVNAWNTRKSQLMTRPHLEAAWSTLERKHWT